MASDTPLPATETVDPRYEDLDAWDTPTALAALWEAQLAAAASVGPALPALHRAVAAALPGLRAGGRLVYCGAGTSGRFAAQDAAELKPTFGWPAERALVLLAGGTAASQTAIEGAEDDRAAAEAAVRSHALGTTDVFVGIAASGATPFTCAALAQAKAAGALAIGIANSPAAPLLALADHAVLVETGAEPVAGSTRLKAGTAQKIVLNLLSTALMLRLGHVHRGLMVDVQPSNRKLQDRAVRITARLGGADRQAAAAALARADGRIKVAVLLLHGLETDTAAALLAAKGGRLRDALAALTRPNAAPG